MVSNNKNNNNEEMQAKISARQEKAEAARLQLYEKKQ